MVPEKKVHVLYIITKLELGGAQKICLSLMHGLQQAGHHVALISGKEGSLVSEVASFNSVILLDSFKREVSLLIFFTEIKNFFLLIKHIRAYKKKYPDLIVHTHSTKAGIAGRWAAFFAGIKERVHTIHGFGFHEHQSKITRAIIKGIEYFTSYVTTRYICVSQKDYDQGNKVFPRFKKKTSLIRAAVAAENFIAPIKEKKLKSFVIGTIACFKPQKNLLDLFKAFKQVVEQLPEIKIRFEVIGDGIQRPILEEWIKKYKMGKYITLLGWQKQVASYLHSWDLFTLSSLWEGLPCAVIEARLSKLPVIAYDVGGISEVIFDSKNGFLVPPGNWQQLAEKIKLLARNPTLHQSFAFFNDQLDDFNEDSMIKKHLTLYQKIT